MKKILSLIFSLLLAFGLFACNNSTPTTDETTEIDYADQLKLDMTSSTAKQEVTVKTFVDGDTTHFNVPSSIVSTGLLKARYIAIDTPESTGQIEEWGKKAANFTKDHLKSAVSIILESDTTQWDTDSTGSRYLVWVWYKSSEQADYRNLNLEILQNGLSRAKNSADNRYGKTCVNAFEQARRLKLNVFSGQKDPDFYYGEQIELTLKELRTNIEKYNNKTVAFEGVIVRNYSNSAYIQEYDPETDMYYGISAYYGFTFSGPGLQVLTVGNRCRIVGKVSYYETGGKYQVSDLRFSIMKPDDPLNIQLISEDNEVVYKPTTGKDLFSKVTLKLTELNDQEEEVEVEKKFDYGFLSLDTGISMENLVVTKIYTTKTGDSAGAMTITCKDSNNQVVTVRTIVLIITNDAGEKVTVDESYFAGKTISVKGLVDYYDGSYQLKLVSFNDVTFVE